MPRDSREDRAAHADAVLSDPAVRFALDAMKEEILSEITSDSLRWYSMNSRKRDRMILALQVIKQFEAKLKAYVRHAP